jgi:DNA-binding IclR family transcriptional regulator
MQQGSRSDRDQTRETAQFCMLDGNKYTIAGMRGGARPFCISSDVGRPVPIPWTASGRLLVAYKTDDETVDFIAKEDFLLPDGQWLAPAAFIREVRQAQAAGEFTFNSIVDSFTHSFEVPIKDDAGRYSATICLVAAKEGGWIARLGSLSTNLATKCGAVRRMAAFRSLVQFAGTLISTGLVQQELTFQLSRRSRRRQALEFPNGCLRQTGQ